MGHHTSMLVREITTHAGSRNGTAESYAPPAGNRATIGPSVPDRSPGDSLAELLIGRSLAMRRVRALVTRLAPADLPVVIHGPTGAGKELVARALHLDSGRTGAFVAVNIAAIADGMFEDALFGHVRGAFTGATGDVPGFLLEADSGTLFLDEIASLPVALQAKLLRAIETQAFRPVGGRRDRTSRFRVIAATNEDLSTLVAHGRFREDLLHRLQGALIDIPALGSRPEDIPMLARAFAGRFLPQRGVAAIGDHAVEALARRAWPGNVRELMQVVQCAAALAEGGMIDHRAVLEALALRTTGPAAARPQASKEGAQLLAALETVAWDVDAVATALGVHRATVYRRMRRFGISILHGR